MMRASIATLVALLLAAKRVAAFAYIDPDGGVPRIATTRPESSTSAPEPEQLQMRAKFASVLADAAREEILPYWRQSREALGLQIKVEEDRSVSQSASPVTLADRAAEWAMRELIGEHFPDDGIYGEEYGIKNADAEWVWVLDPIDGTRSFITGKPLFGTLISALYKGGPVIGIIDQCVLNERWLGTAGNKSTLNGLPIKTDGVATLSEAELYATTPDMFREGEEKSKFESLRAAIRTPHYGADCYAYALVASGFGADLVVEADLGLYDYCAIVPVLEGAGGSISDWNGQSLTLGNHENSKGRVLASANSAIHDQALKILSSPSASEDGASANRDALLAVLDETPPPILAEQRPNVTPLIFGVVIGEALAHLGP
ncbi:hypothetical protein ACHAXT_009831 [Thalassiosira profunda]